MLLEEIKYMKAEDREIVAQRINQEGFDYTFIHYTNFEEIKDKKFHVLREHYIQAAKALSKYLGIEV
jgi:hypothetical protein